MCHLEKIRKKAEYILTYYKGWMMAALLSVIFTIYIGSVFTEDNKEEKYSILVVNNYIESQSKEQLKKATAKSLGILEEQVYIDDSVQLDFDDVRKMTVLGGLEKITTQYFANALDGMLAPKEVVAYYSKLGGLTELSSLLGQAETSAQAADLQEKKPEVLKTEGKNGTYGVYALSIKGSGMEEIMGNNSLYLCVFNNSEHEMQNKKLLQSFYLENQENGE